MNTKLNSVLVDVVGRRGQRQDGLDAQLQDLNNFVAEHELEGLNSGEQQVLATRLGMYDAADFIKARDTRPAR